MSANSSRRAARAVIAIVGLLWLTIETLIYGVFLGSVALTTLEIAVVAAIVGGLLFGIKHPIRTLSGWILFLAGSTTMLTLPFIIVYYVVANGHSSVSAIQVPAWKDGLSIVALFGFILALVYSAALHFVCREIRSDNESRK